MTVTVKRKTPLVVPPAVRRKAGFRSGDQLEFKVSRGMINIIPKLPAADDEYTPTQRRVIDARLAASEEDFKKGRTFGPFETHEAMIAFLHDQVKETRGEKTAKRKKRAS